MKKVEISGVHQKTLETLYHTKIHECNQRIAMLQKKLDNWDAVDSRVKAMYTKEEYEKTFLEHHKALRREYVYKLRDIRNGYLYE
jgi:hypothetical protein